MYTDCATYLSVDSRLLHSYFKSKGTALAQNEQEKRKPFDINTRKKEITFLETRKKVVLNSLVRCYAVGARGGRANTGHGCLRCEKQGKDWTGRRCDRWMRTGVESLCEDKRFL